MQSPTQTHPLRRILLLITITTFSIVSTTQAAPPWEQTQKLLAVDGVEKDFLGTSIALSNGIVGVGAEQDDDHGVSSGSVYLFDALTGKQLNKLVPVDGASADRFGHAVAIDNGIVAVGAVWDDDNGITSGSAYLFDISTGTQIFKLLASDGSSGNNFGDSIAIRNGIVAIGAERDDDNGIDSGSAYLFDASTGIQTAKLLPNDGEAGVEFGNAIAVSDGIVAVGSERDNDNGFYSGSAYLFDVATGIQIAKLLPDDGADNDMFGNSIAIENGIVAVGALWKSNPGQASGVVYLFDVATGAQIAKLVPSDNEEGDEFGFSIAIDNGLLVVGAKGDDDNGDRSGSAYIFDVVTATQIAKILPSNGSYGIGFGVSVAVNNEIVTVSADKDNENGTYAGAAYVFQPRVTNYLSIEPFPLHADQFGGISLVGLLPNEKTWLLYSIFGLHKTFNQQLNVIIDLALPKIALEPGFTDENGNQEIIRHVPNIAFPLDVWFQAVQHNNVTNFFRTQILP